MKLHFDDMSPRRLGDQATMRITISLEADKGEEGREPSEALCCDFAGILADMRRPPDELVLLRGLSESALRSVARALAAYHDVAIATGAQSTYEVIHAARKSFFVAGQTITI